MKKITLITLITFTISAFSEVPLRFNIHGEFLPPDMILQLRGLEYYEKGFEKSSLSSFKKSAKFGNERSKYLVALLHIQNKEWAKGYAWLQLLKDQNQDNDGLIQKVENLLTPEEVVKSVKILENLNSQYNDDASFNRRDKWRKSIKSAGTRIQGVDAMLIRNVVMNFGHNGISSTDDYNGNGNVLAFEVQKQVHHYVDEYVPSGIVDMGVIKEMKTKKVK